MAAPSQYWCEVKEDETLRDLKTLLDHPILLLMGCQKLSSTPHKSRFTSHQNQLTLAPFDSTDFMTSTRWDRKLPPCSREDICHLGSPRGSWLAGPAGGGRSCSAGRQEYEHACTSSADGPFILSDRFPTPPPLSRVGTEGPRPPGLKFKLLVKKSWNGERKHPFRHPFSLSVYLMLGQLR